MISARGALVPVVCVATMEEVNSDVSAKMNLIKLYAILIRPHPQVSLTQTPIYVSFNQISKSAFFLLVSSYYLKSCYCTYWFD
jgi:hypothetical protein